MDHDQNMLNGEALGEKSTGIDTGFQLNVTERCLPLYGAGFSISVRRFFKRYAQFKGRASRSEYWWSVLFTFLVGLAPAVLLGVGAYMAMAEITGLVLIGGAVIGAIFLIGTLILGIAIAWRRLHDSNFPGLLYLLGLVPGIGGLVLLVLMLMPPNPEGARFDR